MLAGASPITKGAAAARSLALISFEPKCCERVFEARDLIPAQEKLKDLIGRLAGVIAASNQSGTGPKHTGDALKMTTQMIGNIQPKGGPKGDNTGKQVSKDGQSPVNQKVVDLGKRVIDVLAEYGVTVQLVGEPVMGPTFVRFHVELGRGVKYDAVGKRTDELRLRLGLKAPPRVGIEHGKVVIDLQRPDRQVVGFQQIRDQLPSSNPRTGCSQIPLGVDLTGRLRLADLSQPENAHILVAGTTGSGKSEWLRSVIAGLIATNTPQTLRLVLIDPKRNAFNWLQGSPFLHIPIVYPDEQSAVEVLQQLVDEMERRYQQFAEVKADTLADFNRQSKSPAPRIVCICDEYADLLLRDKQERRELEQRISRLGAKARAAGVHLILATQQPSREIIKGVLDTNIPARVGLMMTKSIESNMLLGQAGAENLLGKGDLLFKDIGDPVRLQSPYLSDEERLGLTVAAVTTAP
jgi:DNA segregation ATPase FtsK/SpoIIIE-like protein